jgi:hypothetical protein
MTMDIVLSQAAVERLHRPINGRGGFQQLLKKLRTQLHGATLTVDEVDIERLERYSHTYGLGGFQDRTSPSASEVQLVLDFDGPQG